MKGVAVAGDFRSSRCLSLHHSHVSSPRSSVGSRTGAPTVGSGGNSNHFRVGPQSGSLCHVSSPRLVKPGGPISGTGLSCLHHVKGYTAEEKGEITRKRPTGVGFGLCLFFIKSKEGASCSAFEPIR